VPYPNDRRKSRGTDDGDTEALSPAYLAMLVACGGEVREADRMTLPGGSKGQRSYGRRKDDLAALGRRKTDTV
jgi:hypothetical protein